MLWPLCNEYKVDCLAENLKIKFDRIIHNLIVQHKIIDVGLTLK